MKQKLTTVKSEKLEIAFIDSGEREAPAVFLLHGWPDDIAAWEQVAPEIQISGFRTIIPYLRGFGATRFLSTDTVRDARGVALAQDVIDLADKLGLSTFAVTGHDWGARTAYTLAALYPERITCITALALAYQPRGVFKVPSFQQSRLFWYQWFMCVDAGAEAVKTDPVGFARIQWETWSPAGWFRDEDFNKTAESFKNPDWTAITLNGYRIRFRQIPVDPRYDELQKRLGEIEQLNVPALLIQGGADTCDEPAATEGLEKYFTHGYQRIVLDGVGHFPMREAPEEVAEAVISHLKLYQKVRS
jgi:pimeloyl-ACP methyl ester carboxylesterase